MLEKVRRLLSGIKESTTQPEVSEMAEEARVLLVEEPETAVETPVEVEMETEVETPVEVEAETEAETPMEVEMETEVESEPEPEPMGEAEETEQVTVEIPEERQPLVAVLGAERVAELPEEAVSLMLSGLNAAEELERLRGEVEKARREGEIEGRNAKIRAEFNPEPIRGEEIPILGGPSILRTKVVDSIFDLAREA